MLTAQRSRQRVTRSLSIRNAELQTQRRPGIGFGLVGAYGERTSIATAGGVVHLWGHLGPLLPAAPWRRIRLGGQQFLGPQLALLPCFFLVQHTQLLEIRAERAVFSGNAAKG